MALDLVDAIDAQPTRGVRHQLPDEVLGRSTQFGLRGYDECLPPVDDLLARAARFVGEEGRIPHQHLEQDGAQRPPIGRLRVALLAEHLRRNVVRRPHRRVGQLPITFVGALAGHERQRFVIGNDLV